MKKLTIEVTGANDKQNISILNAIYDTLDSYPEGETKSIYVRYLYEEEAVPIPPAPESTPFSRYISNTTPEGRT